MYTQPLAICGSQFFPKIILVEQAGLPQIFVSTTSTVSLMQSQLSPTIVVLKGVVNPNFRPVSFELNKK